MYSFAGLCRKIRSTDYKSLQVAKSLSPGAKSLLLGVAKSLVLGVAKSLILGIAKNLSLGVAKSLLFGVAKGLLSGIAKSLLLRSAKTRKSLLLGVATDSTIITENKGDSLLTVTDQGLCI